MSEGLEPSHEGQESKKDEEERELTLKFQRGDFSIPEYIYYCENYLANEYGVGNLSIVEKWWLKKITEEFIPRYREERKLVKEGKMLSKNLPPWPHVEIVRQFLHKVYGIQYGDIFESEVVFDRTNPEKVEKYYFPETVDYYSMESILDPAKFASRPARLKEKELKAQGRDAFIPLVSGEVSPEFKEHLKLLREKAEMPEPKEE